MTSIERIMEYSNIKGEEVKDKATAKKSIKNWPNKGKIEFQDVSFAYDENLPNVLHHLTLEINPNEKIGIIGRTGAGKSSFFQALFRMGSFNGNILIDDVNIKDVSLNELRNAISIIPVGKFKSFEIFKTTLI